MPQIQFFGTALLVGIGAINTQVTYEGNFVEGRTVASETHLEKSPKAKTERHLTSDELEARQGEHWNYLKRVSTGGPSPLISAAVAQRSWQLWLTLRDAAGRSLPIPSAGTGPDGVMFYSWDKREHHLEAEIFTDRATEFFYRNRLTGELWGDDYCGGSLPADLLSKLKLFL